MPPRTLRILGIDPGLGTTGFGVVDVTGGKRVHRAHGVIRTPPRTPHPERLATIAADIRTILRRYSPDVIAIEKLFFAKNVTTAMQVAEARGALLVTVGALGLPIAEYSPPQVKNAVTGTGRAKKPQVQEMVRRLLALKTRPRPDDAADALAVALTHAAHARA